MSSCMPIYFMSLLSMPRFIRLWLKQVQRDFLWGRGALAWKPYLVKWGIVYSNKRKGGLVVRCLSLLNRALLCKWCWRFVNGRGALWKQVISEKYGVEEGGWSFHEVREGFGVVGLWKAISKEWNILSYRIAFEVGNGIRVGFWKDKWCGDKASCVLFPFLFSLTASREAWVANVWNSTVEDGGWNSSFSRPFNDWEVDIME